MQENYENENTESVESTSSETQVSKKLYKRPKFFIGIGIALTIILAGAAMMSSLNLEYIWMIFVVSFLIGIAMMFNKKSQDIGMGVIGGLLIPLLLFTLLFMLLFGACLLGIKGFTLFEL